MVFTTFLSAIAQFLIKKAADSFSADIIASLLSINLIVGFSLTAIAGVLYIIALKNGELSIIYPIISLSFVWVAILSHFYLGELLKIWQYIGIFAIIIGIFFLGVGSKC